MSKLDQASGDDRRASARTPVARRVIVDVGSQRIDGTSIDISETGMAVATGFRPPKGTVRVAMELDGEPVVLKGRVVRHKLLGNQMLWGIEFSNLVEHNQHRVSTWISKRTGSHSVVA